MLQAYMHEARYYGRELILNLKHWQMAPLEGEPTRIAMAKYFYSSLQHLEHWCRGDPAEGTKSIECSAVCEAGG